MDGLAPAVYLLCGILNELSKKGMKDLGDGTAYAALTVLFIPNFN